MADEVVKEEIKEVEIKEVKTESPAPSASTDEHMIPKSRLDEEIAKRDKAQRALEKYQADEEKKKLADMTEIERLKAEKTTAETKALQFQKDLETERERNAVITKANDLNFQNAEQAYKLAERDENGKVESGALEKLAKESPYLLKKNNGDGVGSPAKGKTPSPTDKPREYKVPRL